MNPVISVEGLTFIYPGSSLKALHDINLGINAGEFIGITGPAGAGKSTLLLTFNGIIPHFQEGTFQGQIRINGRDTFETSCAELSRQIGSVFQDPEAQIVASTVEEEIAFGLENLAVDPMEIDSRINESLNLIGISQLRSRSTHELSGGQKQRVAIAAAVALRPQILILDEPTSELDPIGTMEVFEVLKSLNQKHELTIIVVEQKINILVEYVNRMLIMNQGGVISDGEPRRIINEPELLTSVGLNPPPVSELAIELKKAGVYSEEIPITVDEAYWGLLKSFAKMRMSND
jgi:energy-coupling factor transporter ATP-binding protein EcfA2